MEKNNNYLLTILYSSFFCIVICSCNEKNRTLEFQNNKNLTSEIVKIDYEFKKPQRFRIIDSILVVCDETNNKTIVVINLNSNQYFTIGTKGEGPGELLSACTIDFDKLTKTIWIHDPIKKNYNIFNIDSIYKNHDCNPKQIKVNSNNNMPLYAQIIDSVKYIFTGIYNDGIYAIYTVKDTIFEVYGKAPKINNTSNFVLNQAYSYILTYNKFEKKIAICSQFADQLIIYDSLAEKQCDIRTFGHTDPAFSGSDKMFDGFSLKTIACYSQVSSTKKYIYASFFGQNMHEVSKNGFQFNFIHVFDWNGNPIFKYYLDRKITSFTVDEQDNYIYGITNDEELPKLFKFKL